jgi:DNA-binding transcriptional ArsR family regulator
VIALQDRQLTPRQISTYMEDVPLTTLYRHINLLLSAGMLEIVEERRVHGTVERVFTVVEANTFLTEEDRAQLTAEDITGLVGALTGTVQEAFRRYTRFATLPPAQRDISLVAKSLSLTEDEYQALRKILMEFMSAHAGRSEAPGRQRRMVAFFSAPDFEPEKKSSGES